MKLKNRAVFLLRYGVDAETLGESVAIVTLAPVARTAFLPCLFIFIAKTEYIAKTGSGQA
jgi:hypothetical protein